MIKIASIPANILMVEDYVKKIFNDYNLDPCKYPDILIAITEAVNNAIIHGNQLDEKKYVRLHTICENKTICFKVSDEGQGFNPNAIPDPTLPENIEKCGGRGVFLMQRLSDKLIFTDNGRTVEIEFHL